METEPTLNELWEHEAPPGSDPVGLFWPQYEEIEKLLSHIVLCIVVRVGSDRNCYHNIEGFSVDPQKHTLSFEFMHWGKLQTATYSLEPTKTDIIFITAPQ